ncbi:MAG: flagellar biosynthetic protein FliO, partial [Actinobacteria bacterium]|nr:flagellar biosynthetic protein FliO [Actinomycetota bacterium]
MMAVANVATQATSSATTGTALKSTTGKTHVSTAAHAAHAAHVAHAAPATAPTTVSLSGLLLQVIIALGVIILFVWLVSKAARSRPGRILLGGAGITGGGMFGAFGSKRQTPINVISRQMLGKGMSLVIVEVEGKLLMLGVTQHN